MVLLRGQIGATVSVSSYIKMIKDRFFVFVLESGDGGTLNNGIYRSPRKFACCQCSIPVLLIFKVVRRLHRTQQGR